MLIADNINEAAVNVWKLNNLQFSYLHSWWYLLTTNK